MRNWSRSTRILVTAALSGLAFEFAAFSDFDGARADDLDLLLSDGGGANAGAPPNIMFVFDSSTSMRALPCVSLTGSARCAASDRTPLSAPNSSSICQNTGFAAARGPAPSGSGTGQVYVAPYQANGTTYNATRYPIFDQRGSTAGDDLFNTASTWVGEWTKRESGTGGTVQAKIDDAINDECGNIDDCPTRSRCVFSLRTLGYFWEPSGQTCGFGDPMNLCGSLTADGGSCSNDSNCQSDDCGGSPKTCLANPFNNSSAYFLGDFLNFYTPKGIALIGAFKYVISHMAGDARLAVSDFDDLAKTLGQVQFELKPPCSLADDPPCLDGDPATQCFNPNDPNLINYLHNTLAFNTSADSPLARALDNAGASYTTSTGTSSAICPPITGCREADNYVIVITDGLPSGDATTAAEVPFVGSKIATLSDGYYQTNSSFFDDVAKALTVIDHRTDYTGEQNAITYLVSYGALDPTDPTQCASLLKTTATAGGGRCLPATSATELATNLLAAVNEIIFRSRGFTAPSVPTTRYSGTANLSSAIFRPATAFPLWEGHVFGFAFCDESFADGCTCTGAATVCVLDADGNALVYDDDGYLASRPFWDAQLCLSGDPTGGVDVPVVPMDQGNLTVGDTSGSGCYLTAAQRQIYTAVDSGDGGTDVACAVPDTSSGGCTSGDPKIAFTAANVDSVAAFATALAGASTTASKKVVNFFRGFDVDDLNSNGSTTDERNLETMYMGGSVRSGWWKLGDIFHSTPNMVERPTGRNLGGWANTLAYRAFAADHTSRTRTMLVGANDGMLHAFNAGDWDASADSGRGAYNAGTGKELWAFVSPEMLPKLKSLCDPSGSGCNIANHQFLVDGSVMVRDIWTGGTADKNDAGNKAYWRTVAVYGHRDGGKTYVALDVTDISNPIFLWQFPQPGTSEAAVQGNSWLDTFPAPASIGPLQVKTSAGVGYDRWVTLLSAGFEPTDRQGNVLYMLDAYSGAVLWSVTNTGAGDITDAMNYAFAATPIYFSNSGGSYPYISGIIAADHGGQLWHVRIADVPVATSIPYAFTPRLVFRTTDPLIPTDLVGGNNNSLLDVAEYQRRPFFFAPTLTRHLGRIRVIIGTGDRDRLIPGSTLPTAINTAICSDTQRIYAINLDCVPSSGADACTETNLQQISFTDANNPSTSTFATETDQGWYYVLGAGEKVSTSFEILGGFAMYTTFVPTTACGVTTAVCSTGAKGEARLYARHYVTGKPLDWDNDGTISSDEVAMNLGEGVPTAPAVSVAISGGTATPTFVGGGSDSSLVAKSMDGIATDMVMEIMRFPVSRAMHEALH